jgi:hypothetical protein
MGLCNTGAYCPPGASVATGSGVCPPSYFCEPGAERQICPLGAFCPANSTAAELCTGGTYCPSKGLAAPAGNWYAGGDFPFANCLFSHARTSGFFADAFIVSSSDCYFFDRDVSRRCKRLFFCVAGALFLRLVSCFDPLPLVCLVFLFSTAGFYCQPGAKVARESSCTAGFYCPAGSSLATGGGQCTAGFYCPIGASAATQAPCLAGYYCAAGSAVATGTGQCAIGNYCPSASTGPMGNGTCAPGYYCPPGASSAQQIPCPLGAYCVPGLATLPPPLCAPGYVCTTGMSSPQGSGPCIPGRWCPAGSTAPLGSSACPVGFYCAEGADRQQCRAGSYCPFNAAQPVPCPSGRFCQTNGLSTVTGTCPGGYFCSTGAVQSMLSGCSPGFYCPAGSSTAAGTCLIEAPMAPKRLKSSFQSLRIFPPRAQNTVCGSSSRDFFAIPSRKRAKNNV